MTQDRFNSFGGAALHHGVGPLSAEGDRGVPVQLLANTVFATACDDAFAAIARHFEPVMGRLEVVLVGSIGRPGGGRSYQQKNRAFDLSALFFGGGVWRAERYAAQPTTSLAVEALLRKRFGTLLSPGYDAARCDYIHFNDGRAPGFRRDARSHMLFVQNALRHVFAVDVLADGVWGPETEAALNVVRDEQGLSPLAQEESWGQFLDLVAERGREGARPASSRG